MATRNELAMALYRGGETAHALQVCEENLNLARSLGQQAAVTASLSGMCQVLLATGQFERAEPLAEELQDDHFLADCAMHRRDYALAQRHYSGAIQAWLLAGDVVGQTYETLGLAMSAAGLGRDEDELRLEAAVDAKWEELGLITRPRVLETWRERDLGAARARLGEARAAAALNEGRAMAWEQAVELALGAAPTSR
jgi:hypothetical protein